MNEELGNSDFAEKCAKITLDEDYKDNVEEFEDKSGASTVYLIQIKVKPSGGLYNAYIVVSRCVLKV